MILFRPITFVDRKLENLPLKVMTDSCNDLLSN